MNEQQQIQFFKFDKVGDMIEGVFDRIVKTQHGLAVLLITKIKSSVQPGNAKEPVMEDLPMYVGINTKGLKRVFAQALSNSSLILKKSIINFKFTDIVDLEGGNTFHNFEISGYTDLGNKNSYFKYTSSEFPTINMVDAQEFLTKEEKKETKE